MFKYFNLMESKMKVDMFVDSYKYLSEWNPNDLENRPPIIVVTCFIKHKDKFLVLQRARKDEQYGQWGIPGGKLDEGEESRLGLVREIKEETRMDLSLANFSLLGTASSKTPCDGRYGLYIYYSEVNSNPTVQINNEEHLSFQWVTLNEFCLLNLLTAQGEAYYWIREKLTTTLTSNI